MALSSDLIHSSIAPFDGLVRIDRLINKLFAQNARIGSAGIDVLRSHAASIERTIREDDAGALRDVSEASPERATNKEILAVCWPSS
jgi:hypothetical protein